MLQTVTSGSEKRHAFFYSPYIVGAKSFSGYIILLEGRGSTPSIDLYGYVPPNWVVNSRPLIKNKVSIFEAFSITVCDIGNARKLQNITCGFFHTHRGAKFTVVFRIYQSNRQ